jgi:hypothetical protein
MKKLMTLMLGLGLVLGTTSFAFGEDTSTTTKTTKTKKAKKAKKTDTTSPSTPDKK